jgi:hypothetical protein
MTPQIVNNHTKNDLVVSEEDEISISELKRIRMINDIKDIQKQAIKIKENTKTAK